MVKGLEALALVSPVAFATSVQPTPALSKCQIGERGDAVTAATGSAPDGPPPARCCPERQSRRRLGRSRGTRSPPPASRYLHLDRWSDNAPRSRSTAAPGTRPSPPRPRCTLKGSDVAPVSPPALAGSVYPVPALSSTQVRRRWATPLTAGPGRTREGRAGPGVGPEREGNAVGGVVTRLPPASCTRLHRAIVAPPVASVGVARRSPAVSACQRMTSNAVETALVVPAAFAGGQGVAGPRSC